MTLSKEEVWNVVDDMVKEAVPINVRSVLSRTGGTTATVTEALREWRMRQVTDQAVVIPMPTDLKLRGEDHARQLWSAAVVAAEASMRLEREALRARQEQMDTENAELAAYADELKQELGAANGLAKRLEEGRVALELRLTEAQTLAATNQGRFEESEKGRAEAHAERKQLQAALDELTTQLVRGNAQ